MDFSPLLHDSYFPLIAGTTIAIVLPLTLTWAIGRLTRDQGPLNAIFGFLMMLAAIVSPIIMGTLVLARGEPRYANDLLNIVTVLIGFIGILWGTIWAGAALFDAMSRERASP